MLVRTISEAIAFAEGYYVTGSRASRNNNPGDLTVDLTGEGIGWDGPFVIYATAEDGFQALDKQINLILTNASHIYNSDMTIYEIAMRYTTTEQLAWATNVASRLGVSIDTKISDLVTAIEVGGGVGIVVAAVVLFLLWRRKK